MPTLVDTDWYHALVKDTVLRGAVMPNADVRGSHFSRTDLRAADLRNLNAASTTVDGKRYGMSMTDSDLRDADLRGADMSAALLWGTDFGGADLRGANFRGASIMDKRCVGFSRCPSAKWAGAVYDENTRFDSGFDPLAHGMILRPPQVSDGEYN